MRDRRVLVLYNTCNNPACIAPRHLAVGHGIGNPNTGTMIAVLREWRKMRYKGKTNKFIAQHLKINRGTLKKYYDMYYANPDAWDELFTKQEETCDTV